MLSYLLWEGCIINKRGFTLVEVLLCLLSIPIILTIELGILNVMINHKIEMIKEEDIFDVQFQQLVQRSHLVGCSESVLTISNEQRKFEIYFDRNRIVKSPGYEILLENVESIYFDESCDIHYEMEK